MNMTEPRPRYCRHCGRPVEDCPTPDCMDDWETNHPTDFWAAVRTRRLHQGHRAERLRRTSRRPRLGVD